jgi:hypothetical protein
MRLLRCGQCREVCSARRHTALFHPKIRAAKAEPVMDHLDAGGSVRATSRLTKAAKVPVARLLKVSGRHTQRFHAHRGKDLRPQAVQVDEQGSCVQKKQKTCSAEAVHPAGDFWDHTARAPDSKFIGALVGGKRTQEQTQALVRDTQARLRKGHLPVWCRDGYEGSAPSILEAFGRR